MNTFDRLVELFRSFPGIGPRQARRFVFFLLNRDGAFPGELVKLIGALRKEVAQCKECFRFFGKRGAIPLCSICADRNRDDSQLMIVATDTDLDAIEKSGVYHGRYFVLGGTLPLLEKRTKTSPRLKELTIVIERRLHPRVPASSHPRESAALKEVILGLSANPEGEHTSDELRKCLSPFALKITALGRGLSTGSELEYADAQTLKSALKNRTP